MAVTASLLFLAKRFGRSLGNKSTGSLLISCKCHLYVVYTLCCGQLTINTCLINGLRKSESWPYSQECVVISQSLVVYSREQFKEFLKYLVFFSYSVRQRIFKNALFNCWWKRTICSHWRRMTRSRQMQIMERAPQRWARSVQPSQYFQVNSSLAVRSPSV